MAHEPHPLDVALIDSIRGEVSPEKLAWAKRLLGIDPTPGLAITHGMWLRYPDDLEGVIRVEILKVGGTICQVFQNGWVTASKIHTKTLLRYRSTFPPVPQKPIPSWLRPGAHFIDHYSPWLSAHWVVRRVFGGLCTVRNKDNGLFTYWATDDLCQDNIRPLRTAWEQLDEDLV